MIAADGRGGKRGRGSDHRRPATAVGFTPPDPVRFERARSGQENDHDKVQARHRSLRLGGRLDHGKTYSPEAIHAFARWIAGPRKKAGPAGHTRKRELVLAQVALDRGHHAAQVGVLRKEAFDLPDGADDGRVILAAKAAANFREARPS